MSSVFVRAGRPACSALCSARYDSAASTNRIVMHHLPAVDGVEAGCDRRDRTQDRRAGRHLHRPRCSQAIVQPTAHARDTSPPINPTASPINIVRAFSGWAARPPRRC